MKRLVSFLILILACYSCSFDNKTGIWKDASDLRSFKEKKDKRESKLKDVFLENKIFEKEKDADSKEKIKINSPLKTKFWKDDYFNLTNNAPNIYYTDKKYLVFKSSKLSKNFGNQNILFYDNKIISSDNKGTVYIYSLIQKKKIFEYNFYKKKIKKYKKEINITLDKGNIYASDNLGYVYAININSGKLLWAKHFGIPFRSNIKIVDQKIFLADQDNRIFSINSYNGDKIWEFSTNLTNLKSDFKNNIIVDKTNNNIFFLNTSGELYSINYINQGINWFSNFKIKNSNRNSSLFLGSPLVLKDNKLIISDGNSISNYDSLSGSLIWKKNISTNIKGILTKDNIFLFTKNNLLICLDSNNGKVIWSKNIFNQIKTLDKKKFYNKIKKISDLVMANNKIFLFSKKGYLLSFDYKNGKIISIDKILKSGLRGKPIFVDGQMYLFDNNYRLFQYE